MLDRGRCAAPSLVRALREASPGAPGAQAAVAVLGALHSPAARRLLEDLVRQGRSLAPEAALALGRLPRAASTVATLAAAVTDHGLDATARSAAAAALLDLRAVEPAAGLVEAVLLAATPAGAEAVRREGLPDRTRWALERHMIIEAIARLTRGERFGLDPDSPWPRLERGTRAFQRWVRELDAR